MSTQKPSIGRLVLYVNTFTSRIHPAIVEVVNANDTVDIVVFDNSQNPPVFAVRSARYSEEPIAGTWHWPPRIDQPVETNVHESAKYKPKPQ